MQNMRMTKLNRLIAIGLCIVATAGCDLGAPPATSNRPSVALPAVFFIQPSASRGPQGEVVIEGKTNLPDGLIIGVELHNGKKLAAQDFKVRVYGGQFQSTGFTNLGSPYAPGRYRVHFLSYFNVAWQTPEILALVGDGGSRLRGNLFKLTDPDVIDGDRALDLNATLSFPPLSQGAKAITLVKAAVLISNGSRSSANVGTLVGSFMTIRGVTPHNGWTAKRMALASGDDTYMVTFDFIDSRVGEMEAVWSANLTTGPVHFTNKAAKNLSWQP